jgi:hypothetical protein
MSSSSRRRVEAAVDDRHVRAHPDGDLGGIRPHDTTAQNHNVGRRHTRHAAQQDAAAAGRLLEVLGAHLYRHASRHFAHWSEQRQRSVRLTNGLVGDPVDSRSQHPVRQVWQRRQVQIGKENQARTKVGVFGGLRLLDLHHQAGLVPYLRGILQNVRARLHVLPIGDRTAFAGVRLHHYVVPRLAQGGNTAGHQPDARLVILHFLGNTDNH